MISLFISNVNQQNTSNNGSTLQLSLNPAIILNPDKKYYASAPEVDIVYCFPNIITGQNDLFKFSELIGGVQTNFTWTFSQGIYNLTSMQDEFNRATQETCQNNKLFTLEADPSSSHVYIHFMTNTSTIDCTGSTNVMSILGYPSSANILGPVSHVNDFYEGDKAQLNNIQNIYLLASFVSGSYQNAQAKNILASVTPDVKPYSTIMYRPQQTIYVPVTQNNLDTIIFQLVDQNNNPINMGIIDPTIDTPERWSARIIIKQID